MHIKFDPPPDEGSLPRVGLRVISRINRLMANFCVVHSRQPGRGVLFHENGRVVAVEIEGSGARVDLTRPVERLRA